MFKKMATESHQTCPKLWIVVEAIIHTFSQSVVLIIWLNRNDILFMTSSQPEMNWIVNIMHLCKYSHVSMAKDGSRKKYVANHTKIESTSKENVPLQMNHVWVDKVRLLNDPINDLSIYYHHPSTFRIPILPFPLI